MATSKFVRTFRTTLGLPVTTATIWLVPQANTYPTGALALTAHSTRDGQYYRDNVPDGEYKIYIDPAGGSSPTLYEEEIWIGDGRITTIANHFDSADSYKLKASGLKLDNSTIESSSEILRVKDLGITNAKIANASLLPAKFGAQTKTVVSVTNPTPDYIGQIGKDAGGKSFIAVALTGTMWREITQINSDFSKAPDDTISLATFRDKEIKFSKNIIGELWSSKKDLMGESTKKYNNQTGINAGTGTLTIDAGGSQANVAYDGSCIFSRNDIAFVKRWTIPNAVNHAMTKDSLTFTYATFKGSVRSFWMKKSQLQALQVATGYIIRFEIYELGGTLRNYHYDLVTVNDLHAGFEAYGDVSGNKGYFRIIAEYGDWLLFSLSLGALLDTATTYLRYRITCYNGANASSVNLDILNPICLINTTKLAFDFVYPESDTEAAYMYDGKNNSLKKEHIDPTILNAAGLLKQEADKTLSLDRFNSSFIDQMKTSGEHSLALSMLSDLRFKTNNIIQPVESGFLSPSYKAQAGDTDSWIDSDGTLPYDSSLVPKFYRFNYSYANGANTQINIVSLTADSTTDDYNRMWSFWIRKTSIENLPVSLQIYIGAFITYTKENLLRVGYKQSDSVSSYWLKLEVVSEINGWLCYKILFNYGSIKTLTLKAVTSSGQSGTLDICNITCLYNIKDADPTRIYFYIAWNYLNVNYIQQQRSDYHKAQANELVIKSQLINRLSLYNKYKQPDFLGASTQFPVNTINTPNMTISLVAHDGTLPFTANEIPSFYRMTYDCSAINQQISSFLTGTPTKYTIFLWIRKADILTIPAELRFYLPGQNWHGISKENLIKVGYKKTYTDATYNFTMRVAAELNGWIGLKVDFEKLSGTFPNYSFYFLVTGSSGSGKIDFCNACLIPDTLEANPFEVYYHNGDTRTPPTFNNKVLKAIAESEVLSVEITNTLNENPELISNQVESYITKYSYGANIQNFLKKARDYKTNKFASKAPTVVIIGDSISSYSEANNSWTWYLKNLLVTKYSIPEANILPIHWYGGASILYMMPFIEDVLIYPNPDLIVFAENEGTGTNDEYIKKIEQVIQLIRQRTTADICITTWGSSDLNTIYNLGTPYTWDQIIEMSEYKLFNWYRDIARKYNCELIDHNQALIEWVLEGNDPSTIYSGPPHVNSAGFAIYNAETLKHFFDASWQKRMNQPNVLHDVERLIHLTKDFVWAAFANMQKEISFANRSNWTAHNSNLYLESSINTEFIIIDFYGIGIEIFFWNNAATHTLTISEDGGSNYVNPSTLRINSKPLEYATEVISITYASNWDTWRLKRPAMHIEVLDNILADGTFISGQYKIKVINIVENGASPDTVTCEIFDPSSVSLGTFVVGNAFTFASGKLRIPQTWNGQNNYYNSATYSSWTLNEEFEFYIKSNWIDTFNTSSGSSVRIMGLTNQRHLVKITKTNTGASRFSYVRIFNPIEGRSV